MNDYGDKKKVRAHNRAMDELLKLEKELSNPEGYEVLHELLFHENDHVILSSAMLCLNLKIHEKEVVERIKFVQHTSPDPLVRFEAEMMLKVNHLS
jgi:hypothetical protein